ncbi:MAG TPA: hypothetical protein V6C90_26345 [Coleofasciculaceae cyanobacterium]|jgi:ribosomal protein L37AE/L43A
MRANSCPCCGDALLRHARRNGVYWFCTSCHQEMMPLTACQLSTAFDSMKQRAARSLTVPVR